MDLYALFKRIYFKYSCWNLIPPVTWNILHKHCLAVWGKKKKQQITHMFRGKSKGCLFWKNSNNISCTGYDTRHFWKKLVPPNLDRRQTEFPMFLIDFKLTLLFREGLQTTKCLHNIMFCLCYTICLCKASAILVFLHSISYFMYTVISPHNININISILSPGLKKNPTFSPCFPPEDIIRFTGIQ